MNYLKIYNLLIERAKCRSLHGYKERHHIIPRCLGGTDDESNIAELTAREHFIAHILLVKIYPGESKLILAVLYMTQFKSAIQSARMNNKMYGWLKKKFSEHMKISQSGTGNSQFGKIWINDGNGLAKKIKISEPIPEGWFLGRVVKKEKKQKQKYDPIPKFIRDHSVHFPIYDRVINGESLRTVALDYKYGHVSLYHSMKIYKKYLERNNS